MARLLVVLLILGMVALVVWWISREWSGNVERVAEAKAEVNRYLDRMSGELVRLDPDNDAAVHALAEAADRLNIARTQLASATTFGQVRIARETARGGLYFIRKAREAMGLDPGPPLPR
ncbi:hypothetical protein [Nocardia sp. NPDC050406]|uniref:hypothetical protein n=1 Tax=Nocardia sp. NPDC050406 TaxID=3364318 RepID=UPI00378E3F7E